MSIEPYNVKRDIFISLSIFFLALLIFSPSWKFSLGESSGMHLIDGVSSVGAQRILRGEMPYRDFWTMYAPGHFYLLALVFSLFGTQLMVEVVAASVVSAAGVSACYWTARGLTDNRWLAAGSALIFLAGIYNTGYHLRLGSYPTGILFLFLALYFAFRFYQSGHLRKLLYAGLATGLLVLFKHDVGIYTGTAVTAGLLAHYFGSRFLHPEHEPVFWKNIGVYLAGAGVVALPVLLYFLFSTGNDMIQNLLVFPLTDFRYARPEGYPSLLPKGILGVSGFERILYLANNAKFTLPFTFFLLGVLGMAAAFRRQNLFLFSSAVTATLAFALHYNAAHIQINTHIVSMSVYASWIGIMLYELFIQNLQTGKVYFTRVLVPLFVLGWILGLAIKPGFNLWKDFQSERVEVDLGNFSGFKLNKRQAEKLEFLKNYVDDNVPAGEEIFVGNHRHDVIIIGDTMVQFLLDRPPATRYHELHPAISDTAEVQREMIADLEEKRVRFLILKRIFADSTLEKGKADFRKNLPEIGAQNLDEFIQANYAQVKQIGPYTAWRLKEP